MIGNGHFKTFNCFMRTMLSTQQKIVFPFFQGIVYQKFYLYSRHNADTNIMTDQRMLYNLVENTTDANATFVPSFGLQSLSDK